MESTRITSHAARASSLRPRDRLGLSSHYFFMFAAAGFTIAFLPLFLRGRGLSLTQIGALGAIYALAGASTQVPLGALSDRLGRRKALAVAGALALGATYLLFDRARGFPDFCLLYLVTGTLFFTIATLTSTLISDWTAGTRSTGRSYGITRIWGSIGFIATLVVVSAFPGVTRGANLLPAIAVLLWFSGLCISSVAEPEQHSREPQPLFKGVPRLLRNTNLSVFLLTFFLFRMCESGSLSFLSIYLEDLKASRSLIALAFAFSAVVEIPFMIWVGGASDRIGRRPPLVIAFLAMPLRLFLYSQLARPADVFFIQLFHGLTFSFMLVSSLAFVADLSPGELRGTGQGMLTMVAAAAMGLGPFLAGWMGDRVSISSMYIVLAGVAFVSGLIFILFVHESHPELNAERLDMRAARRHRLLRPGVNFLSRPIFALIGKDQDQP